MSYQQKPNTGTLFLNTSKQSEKHKEFFHVFSF